MLSAPLLLVFLLPSCLADYQWTTVYSNPQCTGPILSTTAVPFTCGTDGLSSFRVSCVNDTFFVNRQYTSSDCTGPYTASAAGLIPGGGVCSSPEAESLPGGGPNARFICRSGAYTQDQSTRSLVSTQYADSAGLTPKTCPINPYSTPATIINTQNTGVCIVFNTAQHGQRTTCELGSFVTTTYYTPDCSGPVQTVVSAATGCNSTLYFGGAETYVCIIPSPSAAAAKVDVGAAVGGTIGGLAAVGLGAFLYLRYRATVTAPKEHKPLLTSG